MSGKPTRGRVPSKTQANIREGIRVADLIKMLQNNTLTKGRPINPQKLKQIALLLSKALPDLKVQELIGNIDTKITISWANEDTDD